jgi:quinol monooxygenase YgiN
MAYLAMLYDRPTDQQRLAEYLNQIQGWIGRILTMPGAVSFVAYRSPDDTSPNVWTMAEFISLAEARNAANSPEMQAFLEELGRFGVTPTQVVLERSEFTPEPVRADPTRQHAAPPELAVD